ncbi:MAG TPA: hypothetical protein VMJ12_11170, partial [Candidatus Acidoferrales bacterium]|nr:hypothetical protein [Candidatus Acidoferrales bacterium]
VATFTGSATLVWNRQLGETNINDLDLYLYNCANSNLVACSTSRVDNVEQLWLPQLPAGRYDLQVFKNGGTNVVGDTEAYALAFGFYFQSLSLSRSGTNFNLTWPIYPDGYSIESTASLSPAVWLPFTNATVTVTNQFNRLPLTPAAASGFFRLRSP